MQKLKIVHVLFSKGFAGTERSTAESCNFQCQDHEVTLVCSKNNTRGSGASILKHLDPSVKVIQISPRFFIKRNLQRHLDAIQPHVVHAHLRRATRVLAQCQTDAAKVSTLHIGVNGPQFLEMDALIAISPWQLKQVPQAYAGKVQWIRNSLSPHPMPSENVRLDLRREMGDAKFIIGGVGRMSKSKGWDLLIEAFKRAHLPQTKLVLIGEGRDKEKLVKLAGHPDILFLDYKHNIKDYYSAFDVFVCPSREEPMGRVILEAMDAGTPVIASDIEGPKDILSEFPGQLFPSENIAALEAALVNAHEKHFRGGDYEAPDLSAHYIENVGKEMVSLYQYLAGSQNK